MKRLSKRLNDKGATLVLVIIAMLFVGIIAAVILSMTVGNVKTAGTSSDSSENFYTTEDVVDSMKAYLQKFASTSATQAYAAVLEKVAVDATIDSNGLESAYRAKFKEILEDELMVNNGAGKVLDVTKFTPALISFGKYGADGSYTGTEEDYTNTSIDVNLDEATITVDSDGVVTLENVKITYLDKNNNETTINTSFTFTAELPSLEYRDPTKALQYDLDKYIIVSNGKITTNDTNYITGETYGTIVGNIYAKDGVELSININNALTVMSKYIISGKDIKIASNIAAASTGGRVDFSALPKMYLDLPYNNDETKYDDPLDEELGSNNGQIWAENIIIGDDGLVDGDGSHTPYGGRATINGNNIYFKDDITLTGKNVSLVDKSGSSLIGYSAGAKNSAGADTALTQHEISSAIVINGTNAALDLSNSSKLDLLGTAYTEVIKNADFLNPDYGYYAQGESITYRSLQSVYLIPGDKLLYTESGASKKFGHNPLSQEDFNKFSGVDSSEFSGGGLDTIPYTYAKVAYKSSEGTKFYYYFFWNFSSTTAAQNYLSGQVGAAATDTRFNFYKDMLDEKIEMIGSGDNGYINLPSADKIYAAGNLISYAKTTHEIAMIKGTRTKGEYASLSNDYSKLLCNLETTGDSEPLFNKLFVDDTSRPMFGKAEISDTTTTKDLASPSSWRDIDGNIYTGKVYGGSTASGKYDQELGKNDWNYKLITGKDITLSTSNISPNTKYVVVAKGDVTISDNVVFNGIIVAYGNVIIGKNVTLVCFGNMYSTVQTSDATSENGWTTEFDALLAVTNQSGTTTMVDVTDTAAVEAANAAMDGNEMLQRIFDILGANYKMGDSTGSSTNLVNIQTSDWTKN
ncbi:MAG: hypothetical protein MJ131_04060 [Lachnospiraceae bacterium]|nr:hypothetical protein [Lachnospiraceae bacterium]